MLSASAQAGTVTVCATGCDYTSISAAVAGASSGDTIRLLDAIHTEANIDIDKALTIQGQGMANTTVQAASTPGTGIGSVFTINGHASPFLDNLKPGAATIQDMTIRHGSAGLGGALYSFYGSFTLNRVRLLHNASSQGGAIWNFKSGLTIHDSIISGNVADNAGGGIFNYLGFPIITGSTISGNAASSGGGIYTFGGLRVTNSTFSGNSATVGGGILHQATVIHVSSSTFVDNSASEGGGIWNSGGASVKDTIVANSPSSDCFNEQFASLNASGANLDTDGTCGAAAGGSHFTQVTRAQLNLGPLALNPPGSTETHALLPGSVAIDAAGDCTDVEGNPVATDQRGVARPQGANCDIGAYEKSDFQGFFQPVANPPHVNVAKAGQAIPVKFSLSGNQGLTIFADGYPGVSGPIACGPNGVASIVEAAVTAGSSGLTYHAKNDQYIYTWKTSKDWANSCRQLIVKLSDGSIFWAQFRFNK